MRNPRIDLTRKTFGKYTALKYVGDSQWLCVCDCGAEKKVLTSNLTRGQSRSCGCQAIQNSKDRATRHGMANTPIHRAWMSMRQRCMNKNDHSYKHYGGRGITICHQWDKFETFMSDMGEKPDTYELERIDVNGNYEPDNCRWATIQEQGWNKRNSKLLTMGGVTHCFAEWCLITGVTKNALQKRISLGWDLTKALTTPVRPMRRANSLVTKGALIEIDGGKTASGRSAKILMLPLTQLELV